MAEISAPWLAGDTAATIAHLTRAAARHAPDDWKSRKSFIRLAALTMIETLHNDEDDHLTGRQRSQYTLAVIAACKVAIEDSDSRG